LVVRERVVHLAFLMHLILHPALLQMFCHRRTAVSGVGVQALVSGIERDPRVRAAVRARSGRRCERPGCNAARGYAGFFDVHHILEAENSDRVWNCVTLCPNCHREAHFAPNRDEINSQLLAHAVQWYPASGRGRV
jgi:predicted HNH restriction endonuclease